MKIYSKYMKTPILFLIYNRPQYTKKVFNIIQKMRPETLFVSADGPNLNKVGDDLLCKDTRSIIENIDWPCKVSLNFSDTNLGCRLGVTKGINWFFENNEEGIILEDDCLPIDSFFQYCEKMLDIYRDDDKIMMISGSNPATSIDSINSDYFFSRFYHVWGWATWKRAWIKMDINLSDWPLYKQNNFLDQFYTHNQNNKRFTEKMFDEVYTKKSSVWAIQWSYSCLINNGLAILPKYNMITNIGLEGDHEMNVNQLFLKTKDINIDNLIHPNKINVEEDTENLLFDRSGLNNLII